MMRNSTHYYDELSNRHYVTESSIKMPAKQNIFAHFKHLNCNVWDQTERSGLWFCSVTLSKQPPPASVPVFLICKIWVILALLISAKTVVEIK